ncbi:S-layer homology domain-containing protein [Anaerosinus massiliensis]|uniref:S-layer homology domain-containing protein n=1 Tax=Massilibacillus massiliensis TaxID=1806837 RepID=UPI000AB41F8C|nr:S-layer homology domain-containing protein [Massilibacillus massiliensis]
MKKMLMTMVTAALMTGACAVTFAAANPFTDVSRDHWSFDAVAKLAHEGVIEGYGDATFRGDAKITRYEMAQMVAKAMAKEHVSTVDQTVINKLSAEYATELNNLGVRVSSLENKVDNVKFSGFYRIRAENFEKANDIDNTVKGYIELYTDAQVNQEWKVRSKTKITSDLKAEADTTNETTNMYAEGNLFGAKAKLGKFDTVDGYAYIHEDPMSGAQFSFGNRLKTVLSVGKIENPNNNFKADYAAGEFSYKLNKSTNLTGGYHSFHSVEAGGKYGKLINSENYGLGVVGFDTLFAKNLRFVGLYAKSDVGTTVGNEGYFTELDYKRMDINHPGSFMFMLRNFKVTDATAISSRYEAYTHGNVKGTEVGAIYAPAKNVEAGLKYFWGEDVTTKKDKNFFRGEVKFFF